MENTNNNIVVTVNESAADKCFPSKKCLNYEFVSAIHSDIGAGLDLVREQADPEIEEEIQRKRDELRAICEVCPVSGLTTSLATESTTLIPSVDSQALRSSLGRQATYKDLLSTARTLGLRIVSGGNHQYNIEGLDGSKFAVPCHSGSLKPWEITNARTFLAKCS